MDNEVKGFGNQYDYGERIYDPRTGRFLSIDPLANKYPMLTPYQFASNRPIDGIDLDGLEFLKADQAKIYVANGKVFLNVSNLNQVARNAFNNANEAFGKVRAWRDEKTNTTYMGYPISSEIARFSFSFNGGPLDAPYIAPGLVKPTDVNENVSDAPATPPRLPAGQDINGNPTGQAYSTPSTLSKGTAIGVVAVNLAVVGLQTGINYYIKQESQAVTAQLREKFTKSLNFVVNAANENLIASKYLNTEDLSRIVNVVLSGANENYSKEINELGIKIFNRYYTPDKPVRLQKTKSGLDFMQNMNKIIPETKKPTANGSTTTGGGG